MNPDGTVPSITCSGIPKMAGQYGPVTRVIGHKGSDLVLYESGLGLLPFFRASERLRGYLFCEHMLLRFGDDAWAQIMGTEYGYGGTGPSTAFRALTLAGLPEEAARTVFTHDGINYEINDDETIVERRFGEHPPELPELAADGTLVVVVQGRNWNSGIEGELGAWIDYLSREGVTPPWADGPLRVNLYPRRADAAQAGFRTIFGDVPQLIIERGDLQLWIDEFVSDESDVWVPQKFRRYLEMLNIVPAYILAKDDSSPLRRWWFSHSSRRPTIIPLDVGHVTRVPILGSW